MRKWLFGICCLVLPVLSYGGVTVVIEPTYNGKPLVLSDQQYVNEHGDTLTIDVLRFYISHLRLYTGDKCIEDVNAHLVDAEVEQSLSFQIPNIPDGNYSSIELTIGVDSATNTTGAHGGDLDPAKGMYWAWNSGYIMAKMEGRSKVCKTLHHVFQFHVGGYQFPYNAARVVKLPLAAPLIVKEGNSNKIKIQADVATWFADVDLSKFNEVMIPGREANVVADRYVKMFNPRTQ